jgi:hypothetical protein
MRITEVLRLHESLGDVGIDDMDSGDPSDHIEDDADSESMATLLTTLRELQFNSSHAQIPKISAEALIKLINAKPGGEAFNFDALEEARKNNPAVDNLIADIKDNQHGIKYVFIKPLDDFGSDDSEGDSDSQSAVQTEPEKTVGGMAKRAMSKRS